MRGSRNAVVVEKRLGAVGRAQRVRVEPEIHIKDEIQSRRDGFVSLDADVRLREAIGREIPACPIAVLLHEFFDAGNDTRIERRAMGLVPATDVDRAVHGDAIVAQRAIGSEKLVDAGARRRRRRRRRSFGVRSQIRRVCRAAEREHPDRA